MERLFEKVMSRPAPRMIGKGLGSASAGSITFWIYDSDTDAVHDRGFEQMFPVPPPFFYGPHGGRPIFSFTRQRRRIELIEGLRQGVLIQVEASPKEDTSLPAIRWRKAIKEELEGLAERISRPLEFIGLILKAVYIELESAYPSQNFYDDKGERSTVEGPLWLRTQLEILWQSVVGGTDTQVVLSNLDQLLSYVDGDRDFAATQRDALQVFLSDRDKILNVVTELENRLLDRSAQKKRGRARVFPEQTHDAILDAWDRAWQMRARLARESQREVYRDLFSLEYGKLRQELPTLREKPPSLKWLRNTARARGRDFAKKE